MANPGKALKVRFQRPRSHCLPVIVQAYLVDTTWSDIGGVHPGSGHSLVEFKHLKGAESLNHRAASVAHYFARSGGGPYLLSLLKHPEERSHGTDVEGVRRDGHDVIQDAG